MHKYSEIVKKKYDELWSKSNVGNLLESTDAQ